MPKPRIRIAPSKRGYVLKIAIFTHYVSIPIDQARAAIDAAHDALDAFEAQNRTENPA